jgi:hypothetical protein
MHLLYFFTKGQLFGILKKKLVLEQKKVYQKFTILFIQKEWFLSFQISDLKKTTLSIQLQMKHLSKRGKKAYDLVIII